MMVSSMFSVDPARFHTKQNTVSLETEPLLPSFFGGRGSRPGCLLAASTFVAVLGTNPFAL